jgi:hypothetical protein
MSHCGSPPDAQLVIDSMAKMLSRYTGIYNFAPFVFKFICIHLRSSAAQNIRIQDQGFSVLSSVCFRVIPWLIGFHRHPSAAENANGVSNFSPKDNVES